MIYLALVKYHKIVIYLLSVNVVFKINIKSSNLIINTFL